MANIADLEQRIDADHIVRGEGVRWFRSYLGEDPRASLPPSADSGPHVGSRVLGESMPENPSDVTATLIPIGGLPDGLQLLRHLVRCSAAKESHSASSRVPRIFSISCSSLKRR